MRGSAMESVRSRNSHIRSPRSVTCAPIGMPSRSLNCAMDFLAFATAGFCPVIVARSLMAPSMSFASRAASPTPMFTTILVSPGICITLAYPNSSFRAGAISARCPSAFPAARIRLSDLAAVLVDRVANAGRALGLRIDQRHVAHVDRRLLGGDAAVLRATHTRVGHLLVLLDHVHALDEDLVTVRVGRDDGPGHALVLAGQDDHVVALLDLHHSTSGASEMIRMNRFSRSSRPTGPKMRVPRGSPPSLIRTAAFSSKRI